VIDYRRIYKSFDSPALTGVDLTAAAGRM